MDSYGKKAGKGALIAEEVSNTIGTAQDQYLFQPMIVENHLKVMIAIDRAAFNQGVNAKYDFSVESKGVVQTIVAKGPGAVCYQKDEVNMAEEYIVRRLMPIECGRLQGFPDGWGEIDFKDDFTDEEYAFWLDVRNSWAEINGKQTKDYTKDQMLKWYNKLHTDAAEYKMWGNGLALPNALYVMEGIVEDMQRAEI